MTSNFLMKSIRLAALAAVTLLPAMACTYSTSSPVVGAGGGNTAVQIYTQPGCPWQMTAGAEWIEIYSARSGSGPGTVWAYLPPHNGVRQAYLNIVVYSGTLSSSYIPGRSAVTGGSVVVFRAATPPAFSVPVPRFVSPL